MIAQTHPCFSPKWCAHLEGLVESLCELARKVFPLVVRCLRPLFGDKTSKWPRLLEEVRLHGRTLNPNDFRPSYWKAQRERLERLESRGSLSPRQRVRLRLARANCAR